MNWGGLGFRMVGSRAGEGAELGGLGIEPGGLGVVLGKAGA